MYALRHSQLPLSPVVPVNKQIVKLCFHGMRWPINAKVMAYSLDPEILLPGTSLGGGPRARMARSRTDGAVASRGGCAERILGAVFSVNLCFQWSSSVRSSMIWAGEDITAYAQLMFQAPRDEE